MKSLTQVALVAILLLVTFAPSARSQASSQPSTISVGTPIIANNDYCQIPATTQPIFVAVEVNSTTTDLNVTLYYVGLTMNQSNLPTNLADYNKSTMSLYQQSGTLLKYGTTLPKFANNTFIWGQAVITLPNGSTIDSTSREINRIESFPTKADLQLYVYLTDVNRTFVDMNLTVSAQLYNTKSYNGVQFDVNANPPFLDVATPNPCSWAYSTPPDRVNSIQQFYLQGSPNLFPFDNYRYNVTFSLIDPGFILNNLTIDGTLIKPYVVYNYMQGIQQSPHTYDQSEDLAKWNVQTRIYYSPNINDSSSATISIAFTLTDKASGNIAIILASIVSMFALLGSSLVLQGKEDLQNRLIIYLAIFIFATGIFIGQGSLPPGPAVSGLTMLQRLVFALLVSTVFLTVWSVFASRIRDYDETFSHLRSKLASIGDTLASIVAIGITFALTFFTGIQSYQFDPKTSQVIQIKVTYDLLDLHDLHYWGIAILAMLSIGLVYSIATFFWNRRKNRGLPVLPHWLSRTR